MKLDVSKKARIRDSKTGIRLNVDVVPLSRKVKACLIFVEPKRPHQRLKKSAKMNSSFVSQKMMNMTKMESRNRVDEDCPSRKLHG